MKSHFSVRWTVLSALMAGLYVAITLATYGLSYQAVQFRVAELMIFFAFVHSAYIPGLLLGCAVANFMGPFGIVDAVFGTLASCVAIGGLVLCRNTIKNQKTALWVGSLFASLSALVIALEIVFLAGGEGSFWFWSAMIALGEFVVVTLCGVPLWIWILRHPNWKKKIEDIKK